MIDHHSSTLLTIRYSFQISADDFEHLFHAIEQCKPMDVAINRLQKAAAMASRLIARRASSFRVQPSFSYFRKMNVALCRLQELNMYSEIDGMENAIKSSCHVRGAYHLPTAANFRYFLIRLQSYAKLLVRIVVCAKESHRLFLEILRRSAFVETITMFMAVTAQIWTECVTICRLIAGVYDAFIKFYKKYFDVKAKEELPDNLSEWLDDDWTEHIAVKTKINANNTRKYQNNIILFNAFDMMPSKQLQPMESNAFDGDGIESIEQKPLTPEFTPKFLIHTGMRSINLNDPNKLSRAQQHKVKEHQKLEKRIEKKLHRKINQMQQHEKKMQLLALNKSSTMANDDNTATIDMGEKIDRDAFQTQKKIVKLDKSKLFKKIDVNTLNSVQAIRQFMVTEELLRQKHSPHVSQGISNTHWKKVKSTVDQLLILGQDKLVVRKFQNLWQNMVKTTNQGETGND